MLYLNSYCIFIVLLISEIRKLCTQKLKSEIARSLCSVIAPFIFGLGFFFFFFWWGAKTHSFLDLVFIFNFIFGFLFYFIFLVSNGNNRLY
jgi:hypothetical protein